MVGSTSKSEAAPIRKASERSQYWRAALNSSQAVLICAWVMVLGVRPLRVFSSASVLSARLV